MGWSGKPGATKNYVPQKPRVSITAGKGWSSPGTTNSGSTVPRPTASTQLDNGLWSNTVDPINDAYRRAMDTSHIGSKDRYSQLNQYTLGSYGSLAERQNLPGTPPYNPTGSPYGSGGGVAPAGIDQATFDRMIALLGQRTPQEYTYNPLEFADYEGTGFRDWDGSQYEMARGGIDEGIADALMRGSTAFDRGLAEIDAYENPYYQGVQQRTPGVSQALQNSMDAWGGAGQSAANEEAQFGFNQDQGMDALYDILRRSEDSYTQGLRRANAGDRMAFEQGLGAEERMMDLRVNMTEAKAKSQYELDLWQYGESIAQQNYQKNLQLATANNAGQNQADQANTQQQNQWGMDSYDAIMDLIMSGINGAGKQTLNTAAADAVFPKA